MRELQGADENFHFFCLCRQKKKKCDSADKISSISPLCFVTSLIISKAYSGSMHFSGRVRLALISYTAVKTEMRLAIYILFFGCGLD